MAKHVWQWDKVSAKPMRVVCARCGQNERLDTVLNTIACDGCPVEGRQEKLFGEENKAILVQDE